MVSPVKTGVAAPVTIGKIENSDGVNFRAQSKRLNSVQPTALPTDWCFEVVFNYDEHDKNAPVPQENSKKWDCRNDPFSAYHVPGPFACPLALYWLVEAASKDRL